MLLLVILSAVAVWAIIAIVFLAWRVDSILERIIDLEDQNSEDYL